MFAAACSATLLGIEAALVDVQAHFSRGLPGLEIVGLPELAVRESRVRVRSAIASSELALPSQRAVVNLAPADLRKAGSGLDLPIALALLCGSGRLSSARLGDWLLVGELGLDGALRPVRGVLPMLRVAANRGRLRAIVPEANAAEAALLPDMEVHHGAHLRDVVRFLEGGPALPSVLPDSAETENGNGGPDLCEVRGQAAARRALEVAAAGAHNLLMVGPPGAGKSMLASRLPGLLPPASAPEAIDIATIASASGAPLARHLGAIRRPFRAPHHSASQVALIGGGQPISPGEVTLAHGGVLFLDELPEFSRSTLEALRPTMESGLARIARARERVDLPARPLIVAAMNPCPCGHDGDPRRMCRCTPDQVERYQSRLSGPLLDRFDMHVALGPLSPRLLRDGARGEPSAQVRDRVVAARKFGARREPSSLQDPLDALLEGVEAQAVVALERGVDRLGLSMRAYVKVLRVARTLADLEASSVVVEGHVLEAIQYRLLDRADRFTDRSSGASR